MQPKCVQMREIAWTLFPSFTMATERPIGRYGCADGSDGGSVTLNFYAGEGSTAAFGNRIAPKKPKSSADAADHHAARARKSRRGIAWGSRREPLVCVDFGAVVMRSSTRFESSRAPWRWRQQGNAPRKARSECNGPRLSELPNSSLGSARRQAPNRAARRYPALVSALRAK